MPDVPDSGDMKSVGKDSVVDGAVYGLGTTLGQATFGAVGHAAGGVVAGASIGGQKGETLSTLAVSQGINRTILGGMGGGGNQRQVK